VDLTYWNGKVAHMGRITNLGNLGLHLPERSGRFLNLLEPLLHFVELHCCAREQVSNDARVWAMREWLWGLGKTGAEQDLAASSPMVSTSTSSLSIGSPVLLVLHGHTAIASSSSGEATPVKGPNG